jgi:peptidoglycan hydrolase-like protein with peptidoglycan-binding domain
MAACGIPSIDTLFSGGAGTPLATGAPDRDAVGLLQELLAGHGFPGMPELSHASRGVFGPATTRAVRGFQQRAGLPLVPPDDVATGTVDGATLRALVDTPAESPTACRGYLTLALDFPFTGMLRVMSLTTQFEGSGKFTAQNRNTDGAGLSFGLIQWAQKPQRLNELLRAFRSAQPALFVGIFGDGSADRADRLVAHTARPRGGTDDAGRTTDPAFDLVREPWTSRFREAGLHRELQRVQVAAALRAFETSLAAIRSFAPRVRSERGVAFLLDVANQHGDGGARSIFRAVDRPGLTEPELLRAMEEESVRRVAARFGANSDHTASTRNRRRAFRTTPFLSDGPFDPS